MKAIAGLFMFLISLISFTGFGKDTTDLPTNSITEIESIMVLDSVEVSTDYTVLKPILVDAVYEIPIVVNLVSIDKNTDSLIITKPQINRTARDVGWQFRTENLTYSIPKPNYMYRMPRDGIRCRKS